VDLSASGGASAGLRVNSGETSSLGSTLLEPHAVFERARVGLWLMMVPLCALCASSELRGAGVIKSAFVGMGLWLLFLLPPAPRTQLTLWTQ
jgi:hypothetical protein